MSLNLYVVLNRKDIPSAEQWAATLLRLSFPIELDTSLNPATSTGYWPCPDSTKGFEFSVGPLDQEEPANLGVSPKNWEHIRPYDSVAVLSYENEGDLAVVKAASATLAKIGNGLLIEGESGALMTPDQAIAWARGQYEPPPENRPPLVLPKQRTSRITWAKLGLLAFIVGYWLYRWLTER